MNAQTIQEETMSDCLPVLSLQYFRQNRIVRPRDVESIGVPLAG
jgi:hypothetical protein